MDRIKRFFFYITKMKQGAIRFRTELADSSNVPDIIYDQENSIYGNIKGCILCDIPKSPQKQVIFKAYEGANFMHDITTGKSVEDIIHMVNKTIMDIYSKKQPVQTATF